MADEIIGKLLPFEGLRDSIHSRRMSGQLPPRRVENLGLLTSEEQNKRLTNQYHISYLAYLLEKTDIVKNNVLALGVEDGGSFQDKLYEIWVDQKSFDRSKLDVVNLGLSNPGAIASVLSSGGILFTAKQHGQGLRMPDCVFVKRNLDSDIWEAYLGYKSK